MQKDLADSSKSIHISRYWVTVKIVHWELKCCFELRTIFTREVLLLVLCCCVTQQPASRTATPDTKHNASWPTVWEKRCFYLSHRKDQLWVFQKVVLPSTKEILKHNETCCYKKTTFWCNYFHSFLSLFLNWLL